MDAGRDWAWIKALPEKVECGGHGERSRGPGSDSARRQRLSPRRGGVSLLKQERVHIGGERGGLKMAAQALGGRGVPVVPGDSGLRRPKPPPARITAFRQRSRFLRPQEPRQKQECGQRSSCLFQFSEFWCPPSHTHTNSRVPPVFSKGHAASHSLNRGGVASTPLSRYSPDG